MIKVVYDEHDFRELERDLKALHAKELFASELDPLGKRVIQIGGEYPPPVDNNRTGHLGRSWYQRVWGLDLVIENYAIYAGWVHGEEQTATHRRHGWKQIFEVAETEMEKLLDKISRKVDRIWRS